MTAEPGRLDADCDALPRVAGDEPFPFVCAGCGDCCRDRRDLVLSGYDLYRIARRLGLSPVIVARAFCKSYLAPQSCLPALRLTPDPKTGHCRFFEGNACAIHAARPLACALYPLGQCIDTETGRISYTLQPPLCGARPDTPRTVQDALRDAGIVSRTGIDLRWAAVCTQISQLFRAARDAGHPHLPAAARRAERALYYDYALGDEFYPQFQANTASLLPLLERLLQ